VKIIPAPDVSPEVTWKISSTKFSLTDHYKLAVTDELGPDPKTETTGSGIFVHAVEKQIVATLSAHVGSPYNVDLSVPVYSAGRLNLACAFPFQPAVSLASPAAYVRPEDADLFLSDAPFEPGYKPPDCSKIDATSLLVVFPGGGVVLDQPFERVKPNEWSAVRHEVRYSELAGKTLLIKSLAGRICKATLFGPIVFASEDNSRFPDADIPPPNDVTVVKVQP